MLVLNSGSFGSNVVWRGLLAAICGFFVATGAQGQGLDLKPSEIRGATSKKPVAVLQNRYFLKAWRPELGVSGGSFLNEAYTDTSFVGGRLALFINEWVGFEAQYLKTTVKDSDDRKALNRLKYKKIGTAPGEEKIVSPDPEVNPVSNAIDLNVIAAPFYGKLNLINQFIIYSDLYLTAGMTRVKTAQGDLNGFVVGGGQRFYWQKSLSLRLDFRDRIYTEKRAGKDSRKNSLSIDFGVSYFFF